ncbi:transposase, partial [Escherichia coli]|uniref:transposase n=1 Tax=Escherichia coli TaxID=562 RepID=UPI0032129D1A
TNWPTYNKALINRGSITFWLDDEAIQAWYESATPSSRGRPQRYSDLAITTVLVIKGSAWKTESMVTPVFATPILTI